MCGRINVHEHEGVRALLAELGLSLTTDFTPRYNIAPTQDILTVALNDRQTPEIMTMRWGIMPVWAKPGQFRAPLFNARSETVFEKASFRNLVKRQRILVPVNGFYEWQKKTTGGKQAFYLHPAASDTMFIGGIFQHLHDGSSEACLLTTSANATMAPIHDRMPVIVPIRDALTWLTEHDRDLVCRKMNPAAEDTLEALPIGDFVNNSRHEGARCMEPVDAQ